MSRQRWKALALVAVLALGAAVRLAPWRSVFTPAGVRFIADTDPHYHVLRAERILHHDRDAWWFDSGMNFPAGAPILWPPGYDGLIAAVTRVGVGADATRAELERISAFVPVVIALLAIAVIAGMGTLWFSWEVGLAAAFFAAVLPLHASFGLLGRPDQHVAEVLVFSFILLAFERTIRAGPRSRWLGWFALALAMGPWIWQGSVMYPGFLALFAAGTYVLRPEGSARALEVVRALARGALAAGAAIAGSLLVCTPPDVLRPRSLSGVSSFAAATVLAVSAFAGLLLVLDRAAHVRRGPVARTLIAAGAAAPALAALVAAYLGPVRHGLRSLGAADPWLRTISEFQPLVFSSRGAIWPQIVAAGTWMIGPVLVAPVLAYGALRRRWAARPDDRTGLSLLVFGTLVFLPLTFREQRFVLYLGPFLFLSAGLVVVDAAREAARAGERRWRRTAFAASVALLFASPGVLVFFSPWVTAVQADTIELLEWLRGYAGGGRGAVLARWSFGHAIQYYAGAPAIATPFGTDLGADGMRDVAAFYYAPDAAAAEAILKRRHVRFVLLEDPTDEVEAAFDFSPPGSVPLVRAVTDWRNGRHLIEEPNYEQGLPCWLYSFDGVPERLPDREALPLRLVREAPDRGVMPLKLFEYVEGARLSVFGAGPFEAVTAQLLVRTNQDRRFQWFTTVRADANGHAVLRVPYATGVNGSVVTGTYLVRAGTRSAWQTIREDQVIAGAAATLSL